MSLHLIARKPNRHHGLYIVEIVDNVAKALFYLDDGKWEKSYGNPFVVSWLEIGYNISEPINLTVGQIKKRYREFLFEVQL